MESTETAYYAALFRRNYAEAQRLYRELACTEYWTQERLVREGHKCGLYDAADREDNAATPGVIIELPTARPLRIAA
jgi:hypothetical protein